MKDHQHHDPIDTLGEAYEKMYERAIENLHNSSEKSRSLLHKFIDEAKEKAVELEELSNENAEKLSDWLKRDINDTANYLTDTEYELKDWLGFETSVLETAVLDLMLRTADKSTIEMLALKEDLKNASTYTTGEITGPGTLICDQCDEILHFHKAGKIPPCPKCHATSFHRKTK